MSRSQKDNIFSQAAFSQQSWQLASTVMNKFEKGSLKSQKIAKKHLLSQPEFKQQYFQPIQNLPSSFQVKILTDVVNQHKSIHEMKEAAQQYRSMRLIERAFCRCTNTTLDEAHTRFPTYVSESRLQQFSHLNFLKSIPEGFMSYCQAALQSETAAMQDMTSQDMEVYSIEGCKAYVVTKDVTTLTYLQLRDASIPFNGTHLFVSVIPKVS